MSNRELRVRVVDANGVELATDTAATNEEAKAKAERLSGEHPDASVRFAYVSGPDWPRFGEVRWSQLASSDIRTPG